MQMGENAKSYVFEKESLLKEERIGFFFKIKSISSWSLGIILDISVKSPKIAFFFSFYRSLWIDVLQFALIQTYFEIRKLRQISIPL